MSAVALGCGSASRVGTCRCELCGRGPVRRVGTWRRKLKPYTIILAANKRVNRTTPGSETLPICLAGVQECTPRPPTKGWL
eukprot:6135407-Prymnesium_polylepis.1